MTDLAYPLFPVFACMGCVLVLIPLPWHIEALNSGTCFYMMWTFLGCLNQFVNSIVWAGNTLNPAPLWCDISTRIIIGASVGIPLSSLCINRRLYEIARCQSVAVTRAEKRRTVLIDTIICVLFPLLYMVMALVVQGHRFNIFEDIGCYPAIYNTLAAYFLVNMWPVVIGLVSAVYCVLSIRSFAQRRAQFHQFLSRTTSFTTSRYFRLMALAMTELVFTVPLGIYEIYSNLVAGPLEPYINWENVHYDFPRVVQYPAVLWLSNSTLVVALQLSRWLMPLCAFVFFAYFGFAEEARKNYRAAFNAATIRCGPIRSLVAACCGAFRRIQGFNVSSLPRFRQSGKAHVSSVTTSSSTTLEKYGDQALSPVTKSVVVHLASSPLPCTHHDSIPTQL